MNNKKILVVICVLSIIIIGLVAFIFLDKGKSEKKDSGAAVTTEAVSEAGSEVASEKVTEEITTEEEKTESNDAPKSACYATISVAGNWQDGDKYVYQYTIQIRNDSNEDVDGWEVRASGFSGGEIADNWNGTYKIKDDVLYCTAVDYNKTLAAKSVTDLGLQVKFKSEIEAEKSKAELYTNGKVVDIPKEEVSTQSKEEKEATQKEKQEPESGTPLEAHGALSIKGTDIVDKNGDKFQLKGISTHGLAWFPKYVNKDAFQTFRDEWDVNLIRLAMYTAENGGYCADGSKSSLKELVSNGVDYATELGMYVIIDWHILSDNNPTIHEDEAIAFFDEMSSKYGKYDNVIYEICNEPNGSTTWSDVKGYAEKVIPVIRANSPDAIIIVGTPTWSQDVDLVSEDPITGQKNIAYTTHFYAATHKDNIRDKVKKAHDKGLCVFISEFSICDASGNGAIDYDSAEDWFKLINDYNLSYAAWNLSNKNETSSLIAPNVSKTSGWTDEELSETGKWLKSTITGN